jgi:hypothetical protein
MDPYSGPLFCSTALLHQMPFLILHSGASLLAATWGQSQSIPCLFLFFRNYAPLLLHAQYVKTSFRIYLLKFFVVVIVSGSWINPFPVTHLDQDGFSLF